MDLQPGILLPRIRVCNRLELHDLLDIPGWNRVIADSLAFLEDTGNHGPNIFPPRTPPPQIRPDTNDSARSSAYSSGSLCYFESLPSLARIPLVSNIRPSGLRCSRTTTGMLCLRSPRDCTRLSVLGGGLLRHSRTGSLGTYWWNLALVALLSSVLSPVKFGEVFDPSDVGLEDLPRILRRWLLVRVLTVLSVLPAFISNRPWIAMTAKIQRLSPLKRRTEKPSVWPLVLGYRSSGQFLFPFQPDLVN